MIGRILKDFCVIWTPEIIKFMMETWEQWKTAFFRCHGKEKSWYFGVIQYFVNPCMWKDCCIRGYTHLAKIWGQHFIMSDGCLMSKILFRKKNIWGMIQSATFTAACSSAIKPEENTEENQVKINSTSLSSRISKPLKNTSGQFIWPWTKLETF